ncbi:MAG TPA: alpha/beta hydrolase [Bacteroidia bacterium]|nr:alpha/beta hydrolase [Bacteroidia bacterium]HRD39994.1 alpha/beta hydrolase [Bacteroidia bacterium]
MIKKAKFKNGDIHFSDTGKGRVVVLLHGFLGSHEIWEQTISNLSKSYRVIAIDLPGHGGSDNFGYVHTMDLLAKSVKAVLDHLHLKKYVLVGHSMGGYAALAFADLFPDNIKGICLYHSSAYADSEEKKRDRTRSIKVVKANHRIYTTEVIRNLFASKNLKYLKKELAFASKIAGKTKKQGIISALEGMKDRPDRSVILGLVEYPIMMVIGEHDNVLPAWQLMEQSQKIQNRHLLYLEHDGHMGFLESPKASNKALRAFLRVCYK